MTLRAGNTLYFRVVDTNREFWVVDGYSMHDNDMCWKVKRDRTSGRFFFVNMGIHGKKWRLPDIYDPRFGEESLFPSSVHNKDGAAAKRSRSGGPHGGSSFGGGGRGGTDEAGTPLGGFASPGSPPPDTVAGRGATGDGVSAADESPFATFDYGGDLLNSSPLRKVEAQQQREAHDARRAEERRQEEMLMTRPDMQNRLMFNNSFGSHRSGGGGRSHHHPTHHELELTLEQEAARHAHEVQRSLDDTRRMETSLSRQRERNDELLGKEMELTSELEKQQLANIEEHAHAVKAHVDSLRSLGRTPSPASSSVAGGGGGGGQQHIQQQQLNSADGDVSSESVSVLPHHGGGISPVRARSMSNPAGGAMGGGGGGQHSPSVMSQQQQGGIMFNTGMVDPSVVLQEQLDLERKRNEDLRRQLLEKDRIILGTQLSETDRERRDMNLRLRCLEAMAAFRKRTGTRDADRGTSQNQQVLRQEPLF